MTKLVIAIDGPAAAGKGTLARRLAAHFELPYLDTGLLYRAVARRVLDAGGDPGDGAAAEAALSAGLAAGAAVLAAEQLGVAQRCLDMSVEYAKIRMQFGRPIGSFQAIKHMCADLLLEVESARSAAYYAAWAAQDGSDELPLVSSLAKAFCSEAYFRAAADNIQIHGGIGFTWEHDAHLYYRRAKSTELMLGTPEEHREIAAGYLIDQAPA